VNAIKDMRALTKLDASNNSMFGEDDKSGITAWADVIKSNTAITELNLAKNYMNGEDTKILGPAISGNEALTSLDLSDNRIGQIVLTDGVTYSEAMSGKMLYWKDRKSLGTDPPPGCGHIGVISIADAIRDMRGLTSLDISNNYVTRGANKGYCSYATDMTGMQPLAHHQLTPLSHNAIAGLIALADAIPSIGAMTSLSLASNGLGVEEAKIIATVLPKCT
jgi:Leucine-rich repeat (LRR) protein